MNQITVKLTKAELDFCSHSVEQAIECGDMEAAGDAFSFPDYEGVQGFRGFLARELYLSPEREDIVAAIREKLDRAITRHYRALSRQRREKNKQTANGRAR